MMELDRKKYILDSFYSSFPLIAGPLSGFVIMVFITKSIGPAGYGIWAQFQTTFSLLAFILGLSFGRSIPRFLAGEKKREYLSKVFYSALTIVMAVTVVAGLIFYVFKESLAGFLFGSKELGTIVVLLIIFLLFRNLNRQGQHILITRRYIKEWSLINLTVFVATAGLVALTAVMTGNIVLTITTFVVIDGIVLLLLLGVVWKKGIVPVKPDFNSITPLLKFGIPLIITGVGYWIIQSSDRYLVKYFMDISQVGIYSVSYSFAFVLMFFWIIIRSVLLPDLSALFDGGKIKELEIRFARILKYGLAFSIPSVVGLSLLAKPLIATISSAEFLPASNILVIIATSVVFYGIFIHFNTLMDILKKAKLLSLIWILIAILNIVLNILWIPKLGITGAAYSTLLSFFLGAVIVILYSRRYFKIAFKIEWLIKIITASILMGIVVSLISITSKMYLILAILTGVLVYGITLKLMRFYDQSELSLFKTAFLKR